MFYNKKDVLKESRGCILVYLSLISIVRRECAYKASGRLILSLFVINQNCTSNVLLRKISVQNKWEPVF